MPGCAQQGVRRGRARGPAPPVLPGPQSRLGRPGRTAAGGWPDRPGPVGAMRPSPGRGEARSVPLSGGESARDPDAARGRAECPGRPGERPQGSSCGSLAPSPATCPGPAGHHCRVPAPLLGLRGLVTSCPTSSALPAMPGADMTGLRVHALQTSRCSQESRLVLMSDPAL